MLHIKSALVLVSCARRFFYSQTFSNFTIVAVAWFCVEANYPLFCNHLNKILPRTLYTYKFYAESPRLPVRSPNDFQNGNRPTIQLFWISIKYAKEKVHQFGLQHSFKLGLHHNSRDSRNWYSRLHIWFRSWYVLY